MNAHLTPKIHVDNAIDESSSVWKNQDNDFNNNLNSIFLNTQAVNDTQIITKSYGDQFH